MHGVCTGPHHDLGCLAAVAGVTAITAVSALAAFLARRRKRCASDSYTSGLKCSRESVSSLWFNSSREEPHLPYY